MPETPHKTSQRIDRVIDRLNAAWDLQIPRLHGAIAVKAGDGSDVGKKCSSRIRALCWKGSVNMEAVVEEFEDKIKHQYAHWIWKPSQTPGTLPRLPATKSFLRRDAISKNQALASHPQRRAQLLQILLELLDEEFKLATDSELYQRTPSQSTNKVSRQTSFASVNSRKESATSFDTAQEPCHVKVEISSTRSSSRMSATRAGSHRKREGSQSTTASSKRVKVTTPKPTSKVEKGQQSLDYMMNRQTIHRNDSTTSIRATHDQSTSFDANVRSFTTNASEEPDRVFSDVGSETGSPDSNATSFMSIDSNAGGKRLTGISSTQYSGEEDVTYALEHDHKFRRSFAEASSSAQARKASLLDDLHDTGPFKSPEITRLQLPPKLPYWCIFEVYRVSQSLSCEISKVWKKLVEVHKKEQMSFDELWQAVRIIHQDEKDKQQIPVPPLPAKSNITQRTLQDELYCDSDSGSSMSLSARLDFSGETTGRLFDLRLNPIISDRSCRFHRSFGADRFITIDMPYLDQRSMPKHVRELLQKREKSYSLHDSVFEALTTNDLYIAGRQWRAFYMEPIKSRSKKRRQEEKARQRLHLFAISGYDFDYPKQYGLQQRRPMSILDLISWHLSLKDNLHSTDMKLFARLQLGLSKTFPTVVLEPHEFIKVPDILPQDERGRPVQGDVIMTDGCARISYSLARAIWNCHSKPGEDVPSAFQARIAGTKGLWQVDYSGAHANVSARDFWVEVRPSQLKIKPHPKDRLDADESQRTFEVVKYSSSCTSGHLNIQLINIMHYCGVTREAFSRALNTDLKEYLDTLNDAMYDPVKLRIWHQVNTYTSAEAIEFCGGMPDSRGHELDYLLESGFGPESSWYLNNCLRLVLKQTLDSYVDKLRIRLEASTTVFCVPDPLGLLAPGEVQLNFSTLKVDPITKLPEIYLRSPKVLVARNPAHLPSDVQMVKAVYYDQLRHIKDVIIFPTRGRFPLADLLSGGDYDGDTVTVIWDPDLTRDFQNHPKPRLATKKECGVLSKTKVVSDVFNTPQATSQQVQDFLHTCCSLNGIPSKLGQVTVEHESLLYAKLSNLGSRGAVMLASLAGYLVDSAKQGDSFSDVAWNQLKKNVQMMCGIKKTIEPAYKQGVQHNPERLSGKDSACKNIIDYLKYDVAKGLRDECLGDFHKKWGSKAPTLDSDLRRLYESERDRRAPPDEAHAMKNLLHDLAVKLEAVRNEWSARWGRDEDEIRGGPEVGDKMAQKGFAQIVQELTDRVRAIEPLNVNCDIHREFDRDGGGKGTRWSLLRASYMHQRYKQGSMAWKLVGDELCTMKARAHPCGRTWEMTLGMRQIMKADVKRYKRLNEDNEDLGVEFFDAQE